MYKVRCDASKAVERSNNAWRGRESMVQQLWYSELLLSMLTRVNKYVRRNEIRDQVQGETTVRHEREVKRQQGIGIT